MSKKIHIRPDIDRVRYLDRLSVGTPVAELPAPGPEGEDDGSVEISPNVSVKGGIRTVFGCILANEGAVIAYDENNAELFRHTFTGQLTAVRAVAISPDGKFVYAAPDNSILYKFDQQGTIVATGTTQYNEPENFSPGSIFWKGGHYMLEATQNYLYAASPIGYVAKLTVADLTQIWAVAPPLYRYEAFAVNLALDGDLRVAWDDMHGGRVDQDGNISWNAGFEATTAYTIGRVIPDGRFLISGTYGSEIRIYQPDGFENNAERWSFSKPAVLRPGMTVGQAGNIILGESGGVIGIYTPEGVLQSSFNAGQVITFMAADGKGNIVLNNGEIYTENGVLVHSFPEITYNERNCVDVFPGKRTILSLI